MSKKVEVVDSKERGSKSSLKTVTVTLTSITSSDNSMSSFRSFSTDFARLLKISEAELAKSASHARFVLISPEIVMDLVLDDVEIFVGASARQTIGDLLFLESFIFS